MRKRKRAGRRKAGQEEKRRLRVAAVSPTAPGRVHDKKVYDRARVIVPPGVARGQRRGNRRLSRRRIAAEHGIGKMKIWRIAGERYRNPVRRHTLVLKNVAGLHNLMFS